MLLRREVLLLHVGVDVPGFDGSDQNVGRGVHVLDREQACVAGGVGDVRPRAEDSVRGAPSG